MDKNKNFNINICVCCGSIIPEGRMVCPDCEKASLKPAKNKKRNRTKSKKTK